MSDDQDMQEAAEHEQQLNERRRSEAEGWQWWPAYHDSLVARQKAERKLAQDLNWAIEQIFRDPQ